MHSALQSKPTVVVTLHLYEKEATTILRREAAQVVWTIFFLFISGAQRMRPIREHIVQTGDRSIRHPVRIPLERAMQPDLIIEFQVLCHTLLSLTDSVIRHGDSTIHI